MIARRDEAQTFICQITCESEHKVKTADHKKLKQRRRGAAAVELAVCLPAIMLLTLGAIEATSMTFLRQALVQTAYEAAKESVRRGGSQTEGLSIARQVLASRSIKGAQIRFNPLDVAAASRGTPIQVLVSAPGDTNTILPFGPFAGRTVRVEATMIKEH